MQLRRCIFTIKITKNKLFIYIIIFANCALQKNRKEINEKKELFFLVIQSSRYYFAHGEMAERSNAAVLKTVDCNRSGGSNPSLSALSPSKGLFLYLHFLALRINSLKINSLSSFSLRKLYKIDFQIILFTAYHSYPISYPKGLAEKAG